MDPMQGMPLGNGDVGALIWCESSRIVVVLNKCDLWNDAPTGRFQLGNKAAEEDCTALKHGGRLVIELGLPVLDILYLSDFQGRISLADASASFTASSPFGTVSFDAFVAHDSGVLHAALHTDLTEKVPVEVTLERYGSRAFSRWYSHVNRDATIGLEGTRASATKSAACLTHELSGGTFGIGFTVLPGRTGAVSYETLHRHACRATAEGGRSKNLELTAAVTSPQKTSPLPSLRRTLLRAAASGLLAARAPHAEAWRRFWLQSYLSCGDDYVDSLWHVTMYYLNSSQRGSSPGRFIGGLWGWSRDVQPWMFYFHWNQQTVYWPLNAAGHHELLDSYLAYRFRALPHGRKDAREWFGADGAFVCDVADRLGRNSSSERANHTPVAEIALDFYRQFEFTRDAAFLRDRAVPYLIEAASFLQSCFVKGEDGLWHAKESTAFEGWVKFRDVASELVYARAVFSTVLSGLRQAGRTHPQEALWRDIAEHLPPLPTLTADAPIIEDGPAGHVLGQGWFKGDPTPSREMLAVGFRVDQNAMVISKKPRTKAKEPMPDVHDLVPMMEEKYLWDDHDMEYADVWPTADYMCVFPSGLLGVEARGSPLYDAACNTLKLYTPEHGGLDPLTVGMARLGLGRETWVVIDRFPARWQHYCNGFGHYNPGFRVDGAMPYHVNYPRDTQAADKETRVPMSSWPFRHMGMESMSILACTVNEALLQSHGGVIRVAPAVKRDQNARFTLHARGGFIVSTEITHGQVLWIHLRSLHGERCVIASPWPACALFRNGAFDAKCSPRARG